MASAFERILTTLELNGYTDSHKIRDTLDGSMWRSLETTNSKQVTIHITDRYCVVNIHQNIQKQRLVLKTLTKDKKCPDSVVKYVQAFKSERHYFLVMEYDGSSLFDFVQKAHVLMERELLDISEWHKICEIMYKQMLQCIEYIHSKNIAHLNISLENFFISNVEVIVYSNRKIRFVSDSVQIKLCGFSFAELFNESDAFECSKYCGKRNYKSPEVIAQKPDFSARSNDIWCLGICLFIMITGCAPWNQASPNDIVFSHIFMYGRIIPVLSSWDKLHYVNDNILRLFLLFFKLEDERVKMETLKQCKVLID